MIVCIVLLAAVFMYPVLATLLGESFTWVPNVRIRKCSEAGSPHWHISGEPCPSVRNSLGEQA
jgi:hypothetical protein